MSPHRPAYVSLFIALVVVAGVEAAGDWPAFRGANRSGIAEGARPPVSWDLATSKNVAWKVPIRGLAHSSPIVWGDRVFVTTAVAEGGDATVRTGDSSRAGIDAAKDLVSHSWRLIALERATGSIAWDREMTTGVPRVKRHVKSSHASATPATDGRFVVALAGSEGLYCFDMTGARRWSADLGVMDVGLVDDPTYQWGPASSPIIHGDLVIVQNDRQRESALVAFDIRTGRRVWQQIRQELPSWATPVVVNGPRGAELVSSSSNFIRGTDPATGRELWRFADAATQVKVPSPVPEGSLVIVTGGYPAGGRPIYAIRSGQRGDISGESPAVAWSVPRGSPYTPTPLVLEGILYVITDNGILTTYDVKTGTRIYQQRLAAGGFSASPVAADGKLYFTSEEGDVFVVRAGRQFERLATNTLGEISMATPAISGGLLIVRTRSQLVAFENEG